MAEQTRVIIIGGGGVGTVAAFNLESGGLATVSMVLRSNYQAVLDHGFHIDSCDHGVTPQWRPSGGIFNSVSAAAEKKIRFRCLLHKKHPRLVAIPRRSSPTSCYDGSLYHCVNPERT